MDTSCLTDNNCSSQNSQLDQTYSGNVNLRSCNEADTSSSYTINDVCSYNISSPNCCQNLSTNIPANVSSPIKNTIYFKKGGINIIHLNINHLYPKIDQLRFILSDAANKIDICGISETFLNDSYANNEIVILGYSVIRRDRINKGGGGLVVYISDLIQYTRRSDLECKILECIFIQIKIKGEKDLLIGYLYRPPNSHVVWLGYFEKLLERISGISLRIILMSDFNIDLSNNKNNNHQLCHITQAFNLTQLVDVPTRVTDNTATLIDHVYVTHPEHIQQVSVPKVGLSDHYPTCISYRRLSKDSLKKSHTKIYYRDIESVNERNFSQDICNAFFHLDFGGDVDLDAISFTNNFNNIVDKHAPVCEKRVKRPKQPTWFNKEITLAMAHRDWLKRTGDLEGYRSQRNLVLKLIRNAKSNFYNKTIAECKGNSKRLWQVIKDVTGNFSKPCTITSISHGVSEISKPDYIVDTFNSYFAHIADSLLNLKDYSSTYSPSDDFLAFIRASVPKSNCFCIPFVQLSFVENAIINLNSKKACGADNINTRLLKLVAPLAARPIHQLINSSIRSGKFPKLWKCARVIPLHKSGPTNDMDNFRPISILCTVSKIIEKHVFNHFYKYLEHFNLLSPFQSGFKKLNSCETGLTALVDRWYTELDKGNIIGAINIDLKKAFNLINHDILLTKLKLYGCDNNALVWFESYLRSRTQYVSLNGCDSNQQECNYGVPQGSILGPLFFILYINDLPIHLNEANIHMYADDTNIDAVSDDINKVENVLNNELAIVDK